jgi:hypothetical protein
VQKTSIKRSANSAFTQYRKESRIDMSDEKISGKKRVLKNTFKFEKFLIDNDIFREQSFKNVNALILAA